MSSKSTFMIAKIFTYIFIIITAFFFILRLLIYFFEFPYLIEIGKDYDYKILFAGFNNGLIQFYDPLPNYDWPPYYLYFWYFIFFPVGIIPLEIGIYIWDFLRLISMIYIVKKASQIFENAKDLLIFFILCSIGYSIDAFFNNMNFLIIFFLFNSYLMLQQDRKWISGALFTLGTFKITSIAFLIVLLIIKKTKIKDLIYYLIPFFLALIPYVVFPDYFFQMLNN